MKNNIQINQTSRELLQETIDYNNLVLTSDENYKKEMEILTGTPLNDYIRTEEFLNITLAVSQSFISHASNNTELIKMGCEFQYKHLIQQMIYYLINNDKVDKMVLVKYLQYCDLQLGYSLKDIGSIVYKISTINHIDKIDIVEIGLYIKNELIPKMRNVKELINFKLSQM